MSKITLNASHRFPSPRDLASAFEHTKGENEKRQSDFFVANSPFEAIRGDAANPQSGYVFGASGNGKSSVCLLLLQDFRPYQRDSQVLGVNYLNPRVVHEVFAGDFQNTTMATHWQLHFQTILLALLRELLHVPEPLDALSPLRRAALMAMFQTHLPALRDPLALADHLNDWNETKVAEAIEQAISPPDRDAERGLHLIHELQKPVEYSLPAAPINQLMRLMDALNHLGLNKVCMLVDGLDEFVEAGNTEAAIAFLGPLCENLAVLQRQGLIYKFFLPLELEALLLKQNLKVEPRFELEWGDEQLARLIGRRLQIASEGKVLALKELAQDGPAFSAPASKRVVRAEPLDAPISLETAEPSEEERKQKLPLTKRLDEEVIANAYGSPRRLVRICNLLFEALRERGDKSNFFTEADLEWALDTYAERYGTLVPLMVIERGRQRVLIGGRELNLGARDFKCLLFLAEAGGDIRSKNELWKELWGLETAVGDEAIDTLISRLRKQFERDTRNPVYLMTARSKGAWLAHFQLVDKYD